MDVPVGRAERLSRRLARTIVETRLDALPPESIDRLKTCLLDFFCCALESRTLPWSRQAAVLASRGSGPAQVIGQPLRATASDAAFANAVAGHGLVREDMHVGSVSHLGVAVLPALLALAQTRRMSGAAFITAAIVGYEVGGRIGRALVTRDFAKTFRPTGFTGPFAAAAACAHGLGLAEAATASALSLAANTVGGLNEWPLWGGSDMYFQPGYAARDGLTCAELAALGAYGSDAALDGEAGLFAAYHPGTPTPDITLFEDGRPEILSVFNKRLPACNFAQTPIQAALAVHRQGALPAGAIRAIHVHASRAAVAYPGCDSFGPFEHALQAKMSIQFGVAAALATGKVVEATYALPADPAVLRLAGLVTLSERDEFSLAYPAKQGASVEIELSDGSVRRASIADVEAASADEVRARFRRVASEAVGAGTATALVEAVDHLEQSADAGAIMPLLKATSA